MPKKDIIFSPSSVVADVLPTPDRVIKRVEAMGALESQPYLGHGPPIFEWSPGIPILEQDADQVVIAEPLPNIDMDAEELGADIGTVKQDEPLVDVDASNDDNEDTGDHDGDEEETNDGDAPYPDITSDDHNDQDNGDDTSDDDWVPQHEEPRSENPPYMDPRQEEIPISLEQRSEIFAPDVDQRSVNDINNTTAPNTDN